MKPSTPRRARALGLVLLLAPLLLVWWISRQAGLRELRAAVADLRAETAACETRTTQAAAGLAAAMEELRQVKAHSREILARVARAQQEVAAVDPESLWATPPGSPLEWDPESPYLWLPKDSLAKLPITLFTEAGELAPQIARVLCLDTAAVQALDARHKELLAGYRALEAANAELTDEHLQGFSAGPKKVTVRVKSLAGQEAPFKQQFAANLLEALGEQRAGLVLQHTGGWFDSRNNALASQPKIFTAARTPNGRYGISIKHGSGSMSTSGFRALSDYVPAHLLPFFSEISEPNPPDGAPMPIGTGNN
jgi:hypothetical protein